MGKMTLLGVLLYTLIPFGQLWTRVFDYNGSVDMWWFLLPFFLFPPLQFIPIIMFYLGYIKEGKGGKVFDSYLWIPIITKFCVKFLGGLILPPRIAYIFGEVVMIISIMITKYLHTKDSCKYINKELSVTSSKFGDFFMDAVFENGAAGIFSLIIGFIPIIGAIFRALSMIGPLNNIMVLIMYMFGYMAVYIVQNMFEQTDMSSLCNLTSLSGSSYGKLIFGIILSIMIYMKESFDPLSIVTGDDE
jgi:hypothetical protein